MSDRAFVSVATAARVLGLCPRTIRRWCRRGVLEASQPTGYAGRWDIPLDSLTPYLSETPCDTTLFNKVVSERW